jgi:penicillin-binding protein 1A
VRSVGAGGVEAEVAKLKKHLPKNGPVAKEVYEAVVTGVFDADAELSVDLGGWEAAIALSGPEDDRFNPVGSAAKAEPAKADKQDKGKGNKSGKADKADKAKEPEAKAAAPAGDGRRAPSERFAVGDVIKVVLAGKPAHADDDEDAPAPKAGKLKHGSRRVALVPGPEGAVVVIDVKTRKVRALVGGYSSKVAGFNRATMAHRQPGSSFKPFVYAAAIDAGKATGARMMNDAPAMYEMGLDDVWKPKNYATGKYEGPILARKALAKSINTVAIQLCSEATPDAVAAMAGKMGIASPLPHEVSIALGSGEVTPLELTNALVTLVAGGVTMPPRFIEAVDGKAEPAPAGQQALRPEVAYVVLDLMRSVVQEGTATAARVLGPYVAGKTGTSNDARDTWFMGLTAEYAIGVWIGYDEPREMRGETGGQAAVPIFVEIAKAMGLGQKPFPPRPEGVVEAVIDRKTGLLAPPEAPKGTSYTEVFVAGTAPTEVAPMPDETTTDNVVTDEYEEGQ